MKHREYFLLMSLLLVAVTGCQQNNKSSGPIIVEDDYVPVYVLAGQSNMEGS
ncbi:MAG: sialate O-acetylesterase, partial [Mollicutes bacterium]|nr:sialate O-acetylesterase [Mollicutes bacterium]